MSYGVKLLVQGSRACFTRPEMKAERVSYEVITPSAARGILEAVHWKPAICWVIDKIHVLKPIRFESIRRNEVGSKISERNVMQAMTAGHVDRLAICVDEERQQRASTVLKDVAYVIEAHFKLTARAGHDDNVGKHLDMFNRRAAAGQCFHQPCLGTREFAAEFGLARDQIQQPHLDLNGCRDLGWMLYDINFERDRSATFYRPTMVDGVIDVARYRPAMAWR